MVAETDWDLSQLVKSTEPETILRGLDSFVAGAEGLHEEFYGKLDKLDAAGLLKFLQAKDDFTLKFEGVVRYCDLFYQADSTGKVAKKLYEAMRKASLKSDKALAFIDVETGRLLSKRPELVSDPLLEEYRHYLERKLRRVPHLLTEAEERLVMTKDKNGVNAWQILQSDWLGTRMFKIRVDGKEKVLPYGEIIGLYQSHNRDLRKKANQIVYENLGKDDIVWASAIRAICDDHLLTCELRKQPSSMTQSLIDNDVDQETIHGLMEAILKNVKVYRRYLRLKARLMGLKKLANYDIVAPLPKAPEAKYSWKLARKQVLAAYGKFDQEVASWIEDMYNRHHLDGTVRKGKASGAWCAPWLSGKSAYVLQSFNGRMGDVYAQAHELGHAMHDYLVSRAQKPSNCEIAMCIAETGSIFGELLLTEQLLGEARTKEEKQAILANVLDEFGMAAFQVSARVFFEQSLYDAVKAGTFLDGETVSKLWTEARDKIYDDVVDWLPEMRWEWTMKVHYYLANFRFYNYPYVFAQLFVFALYRLYKEQGKAFVPKLKKILASGSSKSPRQLAAVLGFDISDADFWEKGMQQAEEFMETLEKTFKQ